jgi:phage tail sheath protein FI
VGVVVVAVVGSDDDGDDMRSPRIGDPIEEDGEVTNSHDATTTPAQRRVFLTRYSAQHLVSCACAKTTE